MARKFLLLTVAVCFLGPFYAHSAFAVDYYVDPVGGSDVNSGLAPDEAFRTITHSLETIRETIRPVNATPATIHLAAGTYSADTNGETFPLNMTSSTAMIGQGRDLTRISCHERGTDGISCREIRDVTLDDLTIEAQPETTGREYAIYVRNCDGQFSVRNCNVRGAARGIFTYTYTPYETNTCILNVEGCYVENGVVCTGSRGESFRFCTFVGYNRVGYISNATVENCVFIQADLHLSSSEVRRCEFYDGGISFGFGYNLIEKCKIIGGGIEGDWWLYSPAVSGETIIRDCLIADAPDGNALSGVTWRVWAFSGDMPSTFASIQPMLPGRKITLSDEFSLEMTNCTVSGHGYGLWCDCDNRFYAPCHVTISDCRVLGHPYGGITVGGGRRCLRDAVVRNCFVSGNSEKEYYGAIHSFGVVSTTVDHCTVVNNSLAGIRAFYTDQTTVRNSILWGNHPYEILNEDGSMSLANCCVEGGYEGTDNIEADPLFVSGPLGDHYLSSVAAGQDADSPCLDAGSGTPAEYGVAWMTTTTDNAFDAGATDIGYHYSATPPTIVCQITTGGTVAAVLDEAPVLRPGETLSAQVTVQNDGWTFWADVFAAFIAADGTVFYITPNGLTSDFTAYAIDVRLDDGLHFGPAPVFEFALNEHVPTGDYTFAAAISRAREPFRPIGDIAFASFAVGR